jgi:pyruvate-formate lyase
MQGFFRIIDHLDCEMDSRVIIGGYGRRNPENADRLCLVAIEACRTVKNVVPQFTLRFNKDTPRNVWDASMRCLGEGRSYPLLYNDEVYVPAMMEGANVSREIAEQYMPLGCGEMEFDHYSYHTPSGTFNATKILEIAIHGGWDPVARWHIGPRTKPLGECGDFDEFWNNYSRHMFYYITVQAEFEKFLYEITAELHTFILASILYDGCIEKGKGVFGGGTPLHGVLEIYGLASASDSLLAIKKLIFEDKKLTAGRLLEAMENNFEGYADVRKMLLDVPKYGNDNEEADNMLLKLHDYIRSTTKEQGNHVGLYSYLATTINNAQSTTLGRWVGAMPDGRKAGAAMSNANGPAPGAERNGVTAMLNSIRKPSHANTGGMVQNIRFSKETFEHPSGKARELVRNYFDLGGAQLMVSVVGKDDLFNAMERPHEYQDLIVRIGGFSAKFVDLNKDVQKEIYERVTY